MEIKKVLDFANKKYAGIFRNGYEEQKVPYINHCTDICRMLFKFGFTDKRFDEENLTVKDFICYSVALLHDIFEETDATEEEVSEISMGSKCILDCVKMLTCHVDEENPFHKFGYLDKIAHGNDWVVFVVKCMDRICNVNDFIKSGNIKYAKIYFHKADVLWNELYNKRSSENYNDLWNEVIELNNRLNRIAYNYAIYHGESI